MRSRACTAVALILLAGCSQPTRTETRIIERVPGACHEAFTHVEEAVAEMDNEAGLTGREFLDSRERTRVSMEKYDAAKKDCLR